MKTASVARIVQFILPFTTVENRAVSKVAMREARVEWSEEWNRDESKSFWVSPFLSGARADAVEAALSALPGFAIRDVSGEYILGATNAQASYDWAGALDLGACEPPATHALGGGSHPWRRVALARATAETQIDRYASGLRVFVSDEKVAEHLAKYPAQHAA